MTKLYRSTIDGSGWVYAQVCYKKFWLIRFLVGVWLQKYPTKIACQSPYVNTFQPMAMSAIEYSMSIELQ